MSYEDKIIELIRERYAINKGATLHRIKLGDIEGYDLSNISWEPDILLKCDNKYFAVDFALEYVPRGFVMMSIQKVVEKIDNFQVYFVVRDQEIMEEVNKLCIENKYGLIHVEDENAQIILGTNVLEDISHLLLKHSDNTNDYKIPKYLLAGISELKNIDPRYKEILKSFAINYLKLPPNSPEEDKIINNLVNTLLAEQQIGPVKTSFENLKAFESLVKVTRDHYYHSFQIFLLGIIIIDSYYDNFNDYVNECFPEKKGYCLEFTWLLTAIFHDVGYSMQRINNLVKQITDSDHVEVKIDEIWNDMRYKANAAQYISLFKHLLKPNIQEDWIGDIFGSLEGEMFEIIVDTCKEGHGIHGCFRFLVEVYDNIKLIEDAKIRNFLVKHVYVAAISISLHDWRFRKRVKEKVTSKLNIRRFPFAVLLMYLDSLHEDRRNDQTRENYEDIIEGIKIDDSGAQLDLNITYILRSGKLANMSLERTSIEELIEYDSFRLKYPDWLVQQK